MHLEKYLPGHAIRFIEVAEAERVQSPIPIINSLQERYGFVEVPRTVADLDFKTGVSFLRGYFKNKIIDKFQIYENGILCQAEQDNALCDDFLGEVLDWLPQKFDLPIKANKIRAYLSQVEFTFDGNLGDFFLEFL
ncbi:MAG: hypothetical protein NVV83_09915 [Afipia sp.]|nr:hypothetical protein [Afipia sp.]